MYKGEKIYNSRINSISYFMILISLIYVCYLMLANGLIYLKELFSLVLVTGYTISDNNKFSLIYLVFIALIAARVTDKYEKDTYNENFIENLFLAVMASSFTLCKIIWS